MKAVCVLLFCLVLTINSDVTPEEYCTSKGGEVVLMTAVFDTHDGFVNGNQKNFCRVDQAGNLGYIDLNTFASKTPSLGATYAKSVKLDSTKTIKGPFDTPNDNLCYALGGGNIGYFLEDGGFSDQYGQTDICIFGDDSAVAGWTLLFMINGERDDILKNIVADPLAIDMPSLYSTSSTN